MFNTFSNINRKADRYGEVHFISFYCAVLSRLAYFNDTKFLTQYNAIMGPIIPSSYLKAINDVNPDKMNELLNDNIFGNPENMKFIELNMPQNINIVNGDVSGKTIPEQLPVNPEQSELIKYISISWSNYGEVYVVADKRMPSTLLLIFRGTYSAKTAAMYSKPTSIVPLTACTINGPEQYLYGIFKTSVELIHTTIEAMYYLSTKFLNPDNTNKIKIITTGHSLGGALCTNFAYLWTKITQIPEYNETSKYNIFSKNIACISLGAPRCMGSFVSTQFCGFVKSGQIMFLRLTTRGDPVPGLPPKTGFQHPCSDNAEMRKVVSEDCTSQLTMRGSPNVNYAGNLDCQNYKTRAYLPNPLSHTIYLDIVFTKAVDILKFLKGMGIAQEVSRDPKTKSTICRLIMGTSNGVTSTFKVVFFDVNQSREIPNDNDVLVDNELEKIDPNAGDVLNSESNNDEQVVTVGGVSFSSTPTTTPIETPNKKSMFSIGGNVAEDIRMTTEVFDNLVNQMQPLNNSDLSPQSGTIVQNPFSGKSMPIISCYTIVTGGKNNKHYKKLKTKKNIKKSKYRTRSNSRSNSRTTKNKIKKRTRSRK